MTPARIQFRPLHASSFSRSHLPTSLVATKDFCDTRIPPTHVLIALCQSSSPGSQVLDHWATLGISELSSSSKLALNNKSCSGAFWENLHDPTRRGSLFCFATKQAAKLFPSATVNIGSHSMGWWVWQEHQNPRLYNRAPQASSDKDPLPLWHKITFFVSLSISENFADRKMVAREMLYRHTLVPATRLQ